MIATSEDVTSLAEVKYRSISKD